MGEIFDCRKDKGSDRIPRFRVDLARCQKNLYFLKDKDRTRAVARFPELDSVWLGAKRSMPTHAQHHHILAR